jgi:hypothetical protein
MRLIVETNAQCNMGNHEGQTGGEIGEGVRQRVEVSAVKKQKTLINPYRKKSKPLSSSYVAAMQLGSYMLALLIQNPKLNGVPVQPC